ncbi:hypothetical protein HPP92_013617 [Vanilla planifolia]|uniref:G protein gamma domain-containing protein n=1 Tax=Vanilla planifolia TaxID=51239 RepID=A0A835UZ03_VANPL|nr:hypothetical protein HPP92_014055 [Vanilla planifolia]KAG0478898.1 hypothetical protein HPP92_013617 [Vanilla planifolia]
MPANGAGPISSPMATAVGINLKSPAFADSAGKRRIMAELKHLEREERCLQEEQEELKKTSKASISVQEFLHETENNADPLLPVTNGPARSSWDRWFGGPHELPVCKCWVLF